MRRFTAALLPALLLLAPPAFAATAVTGTLRLSPAARSAAAKHGGKTPQAGVSEGVVWLEKIPERVEDQLAHPDPPWFLFWRQPEENPPLPVIAQEKETYSPRVLAVPVGSSIEFTNPDRLYHSTFSVSGAKRFDLGKTPPGRRDTVEFSRPGVINLHCEIHPRAVGYVVVTPNHAYASPDRSGHFRLPKMPPGRYVLHAWHPDRGDLRLPFDVPKRGSVALTPTFKD